MQTQTLALPVDYPTRFRTMLQRGLATLLEQLAPDPAPYLDERRGQMLYLLELGLQLEDAWPLTSRLLLVAAPSMEFRGHRHDWIPFLTTGLCAAERQGDLPTATRLRLHLGRLYDLLLQTAAAVEILTQALAAAQILEDESTEIAIRERLAMIATQSYHFDDAQVHINAIFALAPPGDLRRAQATISYAFYLSHGKRHDEAIVEYWNAIELRRQEGDQRLVGIALRDLGAVYLRKKEYATTLSLMTEAAQMLAAAQAVFDCAVCEMDLALCAWAMHDYPQALAWLEKSQGVLERVGALNWLSVCHNNRGLIHQELAEYSLAEESFNRYMALARAFGDAYHITNACDSLIALYLRTGDLERAEMMLFTARHEKQTVPDFAVLLTESLDRLAQELEQRLGRPLRDPSQPPASAGAITNDTPADDLSTSA